MCASLYPTWGVGGFLYKEPPALIYLRPKAEGYKNLEELDVSVPPDYDLLSFGFPYESKWLDPIKVFDRGKP